MDSREIRHRFLDYFRKHGHEVVASSPLIPKDDPSLLFTNAGMVQFKGLFLGEEKRGYARATSAQKCVRAGGKHNDLENVGYTARHHTFFEMLGNFSFGDYFKEEAITWAWELLTVGYKLPDNRLYVSVYKDDDEAYRIWENTIGLPTERIVRLGDKDNFWAMGDTGPCGPCSEILIDQGPSIGCGRPECAPGCDCDRYLEIWNLVFTQFDRASDGKLSPLPRPNIDTGMGLERLAAVVQGKTSNYSSDIFKHLISGIEELSGKRYGQDKKSDVAFRVISDHARATAFLIGDGIMPSNEGRGYVLRRIIRRAIRFGHVLGLTNLFLKPVCARVIETMGQDYNELIQSQGFIEGVVENEERRFADTLRFSMKVLDEEIADLKAKGSNVIPGEVVFKLYDTFGLPADIVEDIARDEGLGVDMDGYQDSMSRQKSMSQESWKGSGEEEIPEAYRNLISQSVTTRFIGYDSIVSGARIIAVLVDGKDSGGAAKGAQAEVVLDKTPFYGEAGGQAGDIGVLENEHMLFEVQSTIRIGHGLIIHKGLIANGSLSAGDEINAKVEYSNRNATACNHSATHLLHKALRDVLGDHVKQAGSLVSPSRLRFDFSHFTQVAPEKLIEVETQVNAYIRANMPVRTEEMTKEDAMKTGAMAIFEERYGETVRVVSIGDGVSMELCGGTHTGRTGDIGLFRIISEGAVAANVRRIEALTGDEALRHDQRQERELKLASSLLKTSPDKVAERIERLIAEQKDKGKEVESLKAKLLSNKSDDFLAGIREIGGIKVLAAEIDADSQKELRDSADKIKDKIGSGVIVLGAKKEGKAMLICIVTKDKVKQFQAGKIIGRLSEIVGGKGGGRPDMAQGGGAEPEKLTAALDEFYGLIEKAQFEQN
jgi:alanyl-tRNA synthetase